MTINYTEYHSRGRGGDQSVTDAARTEAREDRQNDSLLPENTMDARTTV